MICCCAFGINIFDVLPVSGRQQNVPTLMSPCTPIPAAADGQSRSGGEMPSADVMPFVGHERGHREDCTSSCSLTVDLDMILIDRARMMSIGPTEIGEDGRRQSFV